MNTREVDFLRRLLAERPEWRAMGSAARGLVEGEHIGRIRGQRVVYSEKDFERAANLLRSRGIAIEVPTGPYSRGEAPSGLSEKRGARAVSHGLIAVRGLGMPQIPAPHGGFVAVPAAEAQTWDFEVILVVENLEALMRLEQYEWLQRYVRGRRTLAVFRGAVVMFTTAAAAEFINADERPTLAFFDFDPKGLAMAASLPRREALCLPDLQALQDQVIKQSRRNLYTQSADAAATQLTSQLDPQICSAWALLQRLAMGLDQEHFPFH